MSGDRVKVLFILGRGALGGVERHVQAILRHLDRTRFDPSVAVLFEGGAATDEIKASGVPVRILGGRGGADMRMAFRLARFIRDADARLVHAHEMHAAVGIAMRLNPSVRWIQTEHCAFDHGPSPQRARLLWKLFASRMNTILTVSDATGEALCRNTGIPRGRVRTVFNGVEVGELPPMDRGYLRRELGLPQEAVVIGAVGRMARQKGWPDFLSVADEIARKMPSARFVLIGDGPELEAIRSEVSRREWGGVAHVPGRRSDAVAMIGGMDLFLLTSVHEELPTTLLEAFAMGTPVAGYLPEGGVAEILALAGGTAPALLIGKRDPARLAEKIGELLSDPARRESMTAAARGLLPQFDMRVITKKLEAEYAQLRGESPS